MINLDVMRYEIISLYRCDGIRNNWSGCCEVRKNRPINMIDMK